jgi:membrane protein
LWYLNNIFGFLYVSRVVSNSKIYGSLGLVPVFMIGLYFSWLILLFGAQVAYAFQNRAAYLQDKLAENVNQRGREFIALRLMTCIGQRFQRGQPPVTIQDISAELGIPTRLAQQVLQTLLAARLVTEIAGAESAYAPARPLEAINAHHILHAMRTGGGQELPSQNEPVRAEVYGEFARIEEAERQAAASVTMLALVNRAHARLEIAAPPTTESSSPAAAKHSEDGSFSKSDKPSRTKDEEPAGAIDEIHKVVPPPPPVQPAEKR